MLDGERQRRQQWAGGVALIPTLLPGADRLEKSCDHPESNVFVTGPPALPTETVVQTSTPQLVALMRKAKRHKRIHARPGCRRGLPCPGARSRLPGIAQSG